MSERPWEATLLFFILKYTINDTFGYPEMKSDQAWRLKMFMLNSAEHDFFLPINVTMPVVFGISTLTNRRDSILDLPEPEKC